MSDGNMKDFLKDLEDLRNKYSMCYIEAWTPEDYHDVSGNVQPLDWDDPHWLEVTENLYQSFDANDGTNWSKLEYFITGSDD